MRQLLCGLLCLLLSLSAAAAQTVTGSSPVGTVLTSSVGSGAAVTLTNATAANVTSLALTAGTWICGGGVGFVAGSVAPTLLEGGFTNTTATAPTFDGLFFISLAATTFTVTGQNFGIGMLVTTLTGNATLYMTAVVNFASGTAWKAYGTETCVRVR